MTLTTMGMSNNAMEIGSLMYQDPMEFVENSQVHKNENERNNGIADTLEIFFTNTDAQLEGNRINGLQQTENLIQILPNTSTNCLQQATEQQSFIDVQQINRNQYPINITAAEIQNNHYSAQQPAIVVTPSHHQINQQQLNTSNNNNGKIYIEQVDNNTGSSNNSSPNIMYQENFDDCLFDFLPDCNEIQVKEDDKIDPNVSPTGWDPLANNMEQEETFEITHEESGMILTSTQEMIIANGISTEDFTAFANTVYDDRGLTAETSVVGEFNNAPLKHEKVDLSEDPMISLPLELLQVKSTVKCESPESPILLDDSTIVDMETDTIAAEQFIHLVKQNDGYEEKSTSYSINNSTIRKLKRPPQLKLSIPTGGNASDETVITTAQVVNTLFSFDNDDVDAIPPFVNNSTPPPSNNSNVAGQQTFLFDYEDVTQTSIISSNTSRYDDSTAPPTPFSTISYDASISGIERKRRGRPPKSHSTQPDPETLKRLPPTERRYLMQRYKNNEASRQSRLNRKNKQEQQKEEETVQLEKNERLRMELARWEKKEATLKEFLRQLVH